MARLTEIDTEVTGPDKIQVKLVRSDYQNTSKIFGYIFTITFSLLCVYLGWIFSATEITFRDWFSVGVLTFLSVLFFYFHISFDLKSYYNKNK